MGLSRSGPKRLRAVTLIETVLALSILGGAILLVAGLIDIGLGYSRDSRAASQATSLAKLRLDEARDWLQGEGHPHYAFSHWEDLPDRGSWQANPAFPGFESKVELGNITIYTPSSGSEMIIDAASRRIFAKTLVQAAVEVRYGGRGASYQLVSLIADGRRGWRTDTPIEIAGAPGGAIAKLGSVSMQAQAYDDNGQVIPDMMLTWAVIPGTSSGMISQQSRDGSSAIFAHQLPKTFGTGFFAAPAGSCWVAVSGRLWGIEKTARVLVQLQ